MAERGWITTPALAPGGTGHDQLAIEGEQIAERTIEEANLVEEIVAKLNVSDDDLLDALEVLLGEVTELRDIVLLALS